jgi:integral membrane protein (TIGR00529 family)
MPAIAKILIVFVSVLAATRLRAPLGIALAAGGVLLNLWAGAGAGGSLRNLGHAFLGVELWLMMAITGLIVEIGRYMTEPRNAETIVGAARAWGGRHGRAAAMTLMPAVIGLVPMPAGALFSAPFVEQTAGADRNANWKAAINYWFRHVWEYWWPLYPGVIIAMTTFAMVPTWQYLAVQMPFTVVAAGAGFLFLVRPHVKDLAEEAGDGQSRAAPAGGRVARLVLPLATVVACLVVLPLVLKLVIPGADVKSAQVRQLLAVLLGLAGGLAVVMADEWKHDRRKIFSSLLRKQSVDVQVSLLGVLVFKSMLDQSGLLPLASRELVASGIPLVFAVAALPFLAGIVTGIALGFTGTSFPLVVGLMAVPESGLTPLSTLVLAYGFGYMGMMLSPVHLCLLVTRDYFSSSVIAIYRQIVPCVAAILVFCLAGHFLLRALGW